MMLRFFGPEEARAIVNINTFGTMRSTRALLPLLEQQESRVGQEQQQESRVGRIVNVASIESSISQLAKPLQQRFSDAALTDNKVVDLMNEFVTGVTQGNHRRAGWGGTMYHASKVGQMAFAGLLARELTNAGSNVTVSSCCPGFCRTDMSDKCYGVGLGHKSAAEGADTPVWLALMSPENAQKSHGYLFTNRKQRTW